MQPTSHLGRFLKPYWHWAALAPLTMILEVALDLMQPRMVQRIIDRGIAHSDSTLILHTGGWMILMALGGLLCGMGCTVFSVLAAQGFGTDLRHALFAQVQSFSFGNLDTLETGALITRLTNDVSQVQDMVMMMLRIMVRMPLLSVGSLIMGILTSPQLALLFLFLIPVVVATLVAVIRKTFPMFSESQHRLDAMNTVLQENLAGVRVVKAFARAAYEIERFSRTNDRLMEQNIATSRLSALTMPTVMLTLNIGIVGAVWLGGNHVHSGRLQVGQVVAFTNYLQQTLMSLMMVSMLILRVARAEASAKRIQEVMATEPQVRDSPGALREFHPRGRVAFEGVSFGYNENALDPVLKNVSFVAEPGQTVAILGATGAGKSSLVQLIPRFYDVTEGSITIDGIDLRAIEEDALRSQVGIALQESVLFSGTIRDNIRYGRPEASDEDVERAAQMAQAHDFITRFPEGYDSVVGQRGVNLSGGQKQRIAIARLLLTRPTVMILDDSTSAVDVQTESRIQAELEDQRSQQTRFIVAQRISTVIGADKILVLDGGALVAEGTHPELMDSSPIYREIYESQMSNGVMAHVSE